MRDPQRFRDALDRLHVGDSIHVVAWHGSARFETTMTMEGYERPTVKLENRPDATPVQRLRLAEWMAGR
jgi:hypothetical protein